LRAFSRFHCAIVAVATRRGRIDPRLVVGNDHHRIDRRPLPVEQRQQGRDIGAAAAHRRQHCRIHGDTGTGIERHIHHLLFERDHTGIRIAPQHGHRQLRRHVHHRARLPGMDGSLGNKQRIARLCYRQHVGQRGSALE
jgi:hypothetical protein